MLKLIEEHYLFFILFIIILFKDTFVSFLPVTHVVPNTCEYLLNDYNKLLKFSGIDSRYQNSVNTYIIYKDVYDYLEYVMIKGGKDLEFNNNYVIYNNTLIGVIDKVDKNSSRVKLLTNRNTKIAVKINNEVGVLSYDSKLKVSNISNYSNITVGSSIYTTDFDSNYENVYIGKVKEIRLINSGIEQEIIVDYDINIKEILYVTVLGKKL